MRESNRSIAARCACTTACASMSPSWTPRAISTAESQATELSIIPILHILQEMASAATELLADLVAIDSVNPDLVPAGAGEEELSRFVADWCSRAGLEGEIEEVSAMGPPLMERTGGADAASVAEPTEERVCVAHKGFVAWEIETFGRAAHGSRPDLGIDAIARMGGVLVALEKLDRRLRAGPAHPLLGTGSVHASLIEGGQEYSSYPARCVLVGERRTIPGESDEMVQRELRELLRDLEGSSRIKLSRAPFETRSDEPIVQLVSRLADTTGGGRGGVLGDSGP